VTRWARRPAVSAPAGIVGERGHALLLLVEIEDRAVLVGYGQVCIADQGGDHGVVESGRERVLRTAAELFYERGFHAVGVDLIIERAGVAKTTLYRHFRSKDDLIVAYLEDANTRFWTWFDAAVDRDRPPREQLVGLFEGVAKLTSSPACLGCTFQVTAAEFPDPDHPGHATALAHKQAVRTRLRDLASGAGAADPAALADGLLLVMDGAFAAARMYGPASPAARVATIAHTLIDANTPVPQRPRRAAKRGT
jgi:AcrR family transcriptional regulator